MGRASGGVKSYISPGPGGSSTLAVPVLFPCGLAGAVKATDGVLNGTSSATHTSAACHKTHGNCKKNNAVAVARSELLAPQQQDFDLNLKAKKGWALHPDFA